jgi:hypothetical protein
LSDGIARRVIYNKTGTLEHLSSDSSAMFFGMY